MLLSSIFNHQQIYTLQNHHQEHHFPQTQHYERQDVHRMQTPTRTLKIYTTEITSEHKTHMIHRFQGYTLKLLPLYEHINQTTSFAIQTTQHVLTALTQPNIAHNYYTILHMNVTPKIL